MCCILEKVNEDWSTPEGHAGSGEESLCVPSLAGLFLDAVRFLARFKGAAALPLQSWSAFEATVRDMAQKGTAVKQFVAQEPEDHSTFSFGGSPQTPRRPTHSQFDRAPSQTRSIG